MTLVSAMQTVGAIGSLLVACGPGLRMPEAASILLMTLRLLDLERHRFVSAQSRLRAYKGDRLLHSRNRPRTGSAAPPRGASPDTNQAQARIGGFAVLPDTWESSRVRDAAPEPSRRVIREGEEGGVVHARGCRQREGCAPSADTPARSR